MLSNLQQGKQFYYADRTLGKPVRCKILDVHYSFPTKIITENIETGKTFTCYNDFGCYELSKYKDALSDAQTQEDRLIY